MFFKRSLRGTHPPLKINKKSYLKSTTMGANSSMLEEEGQPIAQSYRQSFVIQPYYPPGNVIYPIDQTSFNSGIGRPVGQTAGQEYGTRIPTCEGGASIINPCCESFSSCDGIYKLNFSDIISATNPQSGRKAQFTGMINGTTGLLTVITTSIPGVFIFDVKYDKNTWAIGPMGGISCHPALFCITGDKITYV